MPRWRCQRTPMLFLAHVDLRRGRHPREVEEAFFRERYRMRKAIAAHDTEELSGLLSKIARYYQKLNVVNPNPYQQVCGGRDTHSALRPP